MSHGRREGKSDGTCWKQRLEKKKAISFSYSIKFSLFNTSATHTLKRPYIKKHGLKDSA